MNGNKCTYFLIFLLLIFSCMQGNGQFSRGNITLGWDAGFSIPSGQISNGAFPLGYAGNGHAAQLTIQYGLFDTWDIRAVVGLSQQSFDFNEAAHSVFSRYPLAVSTDMTASPYRMLSFIAGPAKHISLSQKFSLSVSPAAGMAILQTPDIVMNIITQPLTVITLGSGRSQSFIYQMSFSTIYHWNRTVDFKLFAQYSSASFHPTVVNEETSLSFRQFVFGAGLGVHLVHSHKD
ncbi:MAG TPA: hypothetical protein PKC30_01335 [Saprospiraceae bacterium]|nr:hypothetical protein [Saprospiraceae bacterium]